MDQQIAGVPDWLNASPEGLNFSRQLADSYLDSRVVYYPGSGHDFAPMPLFARAAHCYLYADYSTDLAEPPSIPDCTMVHSQVLTSEELLRGLGLDQLRVPPIELLTEIERVQLAHLFPGQRVRGGRWSVLEQLVIVEGAPIRKRIALLQVQGEAVWLYRAIWGLRNPSPSLFALYTAHDGPNWTNWTTGGKLFSVAVNHDNFPLWYRCFDGREWPEYDEQFRDATGRAVFRRTTDSGRLEGMHLFLRARDMLQGSLSPDEEKQLAQCKIPPTENFWFRRYARFMKETDPKAFEALETNWRFITHWLDYFDSLDDDASRWQ